MVTIIVLLILTAVAINLTIGQNGIFTRAQNATAKYEESSLNEQDEIDKAVNFIDKYMNGNGEVDDTEKSEVEKARDSENFFDKDTTIKDDLDNEVRIPQDFKVAKDSATKVEDGIVIEDRVGNQFVWIPAKTGLGATIHTTLGDKTIVYKRTAFGHNIATGEIDKKTNSEKIEDRSYYYVESLSEVEETSVDVNGGYYIGRFEAGDKVSTEAGKMRASGDLQSNEVSIKSGQVPYVYATYDNLKSLAEGMGSKRGYTGTTRMISSYAWDTAINFIQIKVPDYGTNSPQGNYLDTTFNYANIGETEKTETKEEGNYTELVPTGQTTPVSNIYDMGGNAYEYTTESYAYKSFPIVPRGGCYLDSFSLDQYTNYAAGCRGVDDGDGGSRYAFRVSLFCSPER